MEGRKRSDCEVVGNAVNNRDFWEMCGRDIRQAFSLMHKGHAWLFVDVSAHAICGFAIAIIVLLVVGAESTLH
jgi:hypothetical protein